MSAVDAIVVGVAEVTDAGRAGLDGGAQAATLPLTPRELQAARAAADGATTAEVGAALGISARTAKAYLDGARRKLGVGHKRMLGRALRELERN